MSSDRALAVGMVNSTQPRVKDGRTKAVVGVALVLVPGVAMGVVGRTLVELLEALRALGETISVV